VLQSTFEPLNAVRHRMALTQASHLPEAKAYLDRRACRGRAEKRGVPSRATSRAILRLWQAGQPSIAATRRRTTARLG